MDTYWSWMLGDRAEDSLLPRDCHDLLQLTRQSGAIVVLRYEHQRALAELLLALPDVVAWCWVRSGDWRCRVSPIITTVRDV